MIQQQRITAEDIAAHKMKNGLKGSVYDENRFVGMGNARYALWLCTAIKEGIIRTDGKIEF